MVRSGERGASAHALSATLGAAARELGLDLTTAQVTALVAYAQLVMKWQRVTNLTGARDAGQFLREHIVDCLALVPWVPAGHVLDVGSGAGLPGIVVAIALPDCHVTLLEPRARRARFLTQARIELALGNVSVEQCRLEELAPSADYAAVVARAWAALPVFVAAAAPWQRRGARLVAMHAELDAAALAEAESRAGSARVVPLAIPGFRARNLVIFDAPPRAAGPKPVVP